MRQARAALVAGGRSLSRDRLADRMREDGYRVSNARVGLLLRLLTSEDVAGPVDVSARRPDDAEYAACQRRGGVGDPETCRSWRQFSSGLAVRWQAARVHEMRSDPITLRLPSPLFELRDDRLERAQVRLLIKRDDLIHPEIPGNKWRKLSYNLSAATNAGHDTLLTFGGAYSNHLRATAAAGYYFGFRTIGVVRGEEHLPLNPSLEYATRRGMRLTYLDRTTYREKQSLTVIEALRREWGRFYLLPEGGSNSLALKGCAEIPEEIDATFDVICCAVGTGGTLAGIAAGLREGQRAIGFSALKGGDFLADDVARLQSEAGLASANWRIECAYHFGGFAKTTPQLQTFIDTFAERHGIVLDRVYVAKMMFGIFDMIQTGAFPAGATMVAVITG
ncbi:1-aminocyclopropane-1-carboxylate deaminase/D-cysteine desulfhydrase [Rugosimonospora africana]|uniref:1-aminocyclopropane-1-carboxylate deaminase/D-cysteine desulfhydrase n=1 Tax=Rugosimonospora africana TaxID=556532 RepID=UPI001EF1C0FF|nr:pyridoxal-phosphate dependent enzyme [Rugosimonospora africana]